MSETNTVNATEKTSNQFDLLLRAACAALLVAATIVCAGLTVYFGNEAEFPFELKALHIPMSILSVSLFLVLLLAQFPFKKTLYFCIANYMFFCIGVCLYFQSNWFLWDLGPLMAGEFWWDWAEHGKNTLIESGLYIALIALFILGRKWLYNNLVKLSLVIIVIELIALFPLVLHHGGNYSYKYYTIDNSKKFEFAKDKNIIICVFDCFTTPLMEELFKESPELKDIFDDFTMYTRVIAKKPFTQNAIPAVMTGENLEKIDDKTLSSCYFNEKKSILLKVKRQSFTSEIYPYVDNVFYYDPSIVSNIIPKSKDDNSSLTCKEMQQFVNAVALRVTPLCLKGYISRHICKMTGVMLIPQTAVDNKSERVSELPDNIRFYLELKNKACVSDSINSVFKYYHVKGVHFPFDTDQFLNPLPNTDGKPSQSKECYINQAKGCLLIVKELIKQLKKLDLYDRSVIIFMGDHGRMDDAYGITGKIPGEYNPMLLVKTFHEESHKLRKCSNILLQTDICMNSVWNSIETADSNSLWGSDFDKQQIDARESIWETYLKKNNTGRRQFATFESEGEVIDFSKSIVLSCPTPCFDDYNMVGELRLFCVPKQFKFKYGNLDLLLSNSQNTYRVELKYEGDFLYYSCNTSEVADGDYNLYYRVNSAYGTRIIKFPGCIIHIHNGKRNVE